MGKYKWLTYDDRKAIEKLYNKKIPVRKIAEQVGISYVTVYAELKRGATGEMDANGRMGYSAEKAQKALFSKGVGKYT